MKHYNLVICVGGLCGCLFVTALLAGFDELPSYDDPITIRGDVSPSNAAYTISRPGVYKLTSAKTASGVPNISITANNVTLDLGGNTLTGGTNGIEITGNNVTVKNGTVSGMTQSGIKILGNDGLLQNITAEDNVTGIECSGVDGAIVRSCRSLNNTREGFLLTNAQNNRFEDCQAINTSGVGTVAGFRTTGTGNVFIGCKVNGVISSNADAYGILTLNQTNALMQDCSIANINGLAYTAGVGLIGDVLITPPVQDISFADTRFARFPDWLNTQEGSFIAMAKESSSGNVRIFNFSPTDGLTSVTYTQDFSGSTKGSKWLSWNDKYYLAVSGNNGGNNDIFVYEFDPTFSTLTSIASYGYDTGNVIVTCCDWVVSGSFAYLFYVGDKVSGYELGALRFDGQSLVPLSGKNYDYNLLSVKVHFYKNKIRLAVTTVRFDASVPDIQIHGFENEAITDILTNYDLLTNGLMEKSSWLDFDGQTYLAFGINNTASSPTVRIARYTEDPTPTLTDFATFDYGGAAYDVDFLVTGTTIYVAVGGNRSGQKTKILLFDPYEDVVTTRLKSFYDYSSDTVDTSAVVWNRIIDENNKIFLITAKSSSPTLRVLGFGLGGQSQNNKVSDNMISNVSGGDGVLVDFVSNNILKNTAVNCQDSFVTSLRTSYAASEYAGEVANFVTSQANARGVYNIDTNLTTPDTVGLIVDSVYTIESKIDSLFQDSETVESKLDYLTACDYEALPAPTTLSTDYGAYCLSADMSGNLFITGTGITLCLNGHTITGGTNGVIISGDEVVIKNGTVRNATASGINVTGDKCVLENIESVGNVTGFEFSGADNCTITNCRALDNTREGFLLTNAQKNSFEQCEAINTNGSGVVAGFKTSSGSGNNFVDCKINGVISSNGQAYGMLGLHELKTNINDSTVMNIAPTSQGAGIALIGDYLGTPTVQYFASIGDVERKSFDVDWLNTPVGSYIASTDYSAGTDKKVKVEQFSVDAGMTDFGFTGTLVSDIRAVSWLTWNNAYYLAVGGNGGAGTTYPDIKVFSCVLSDTLSMTVEKASYANTTDGTVSALEWFLSGTIPYLAYAASEGFTGELGVLEFSGNSLSLVDSIETGSTIIPLRAHIYNGKIRLTAGIQTNDGVRVYAFDEPQGSKKLIEKARISANNSYVTPYDLSWLDYDGKTYIAAVFSGNSSNSTQVFEYTENPSAALTLFATGAVELSQGVDWLVTGTTIYLAVSSNYVASPTRILLFDPNKFSSQLTSYYRVEVSAVDEQVTNRLRWNRVAGNDKRVYLAVGKGRWVSPVIDPYLRVYGFDINNQSDLNLVNNNTISGVPGGDGVLLDEKINSAYDNAAYNCQDGFVSGVRTSYTKPAFSASNSYVPG